MPQNRGSAQADPLCIQAIECSCLWRTLPLPFSGIRQWCSPFAAVQKPKPYQGLGLDPDDPALSQYAREVIQRTQLFLQLNEFQWASIQLPAVRPVISRSDTV